LDAGISDFRSSGVTMHVNKVHHVTRIKRVAEDLGEDEDYAEWIRMSRQLRKTRARK
jgi:hypothetical protein